MTILSGVQVPPEAGQGRGRATLSGYVSIRTFRSGTRYGLGPRLLVLRGEGLGYLLSARLTYVLHVYVFVFVLLFVLFVVLVIICVYPQRATHVLECEAGALTNGLAPTVTKSSICFTGRLHFI